MTNDPGLADIDRFMIKKPRKTGNTDLLFLDGNKHWQSLTNKCTGEFLAAKALREKFVGLNIMKSLDETPSHWRDLLRLQLNLDVNYQRI